MSSIRFTLLVLGVLALHSPYICGLAMWLWSRPHYQHFPIIVIAAVGLAVHRLSGVDMKENARLTIRVIVYGGLSTLVFGLAVWTNSNWLGALSAISWSWTLIWFTGGALLANTLRGPLTVLLLVMPIPINFDLRLIIELQKIASSIASSLLDMFDVRHSLSGVAINTLDRKFMVEEACSGIHSFFSCICVIVGLGVIRRYSAIRLLVSILHTVAWVIAANSLRVFLVVYASSKYDIGLDSGWKHELLGGLTYVTALLFALSLDRMIQFVVPLASASVAPNTAFTAFENGFNQVTGTLTPYRDIIIRFLDSPRVSRKASMAVIVAILVLMVTPLGVTGAVQKYRDFRRIPTAIVTDAPNFVQQMNQKLTQTFAPPRVGNWKLVKVRQLSRDPNDPLGANSIICTYEGGGVKVEFSIDGFYPEWHDLAYCYSALDWKVKSQNNQKSSWDSHLTRLSLYTDSGSHALVLFSCFDQKFTSVEPADPSLEVIQTFTTLLNRLPQSGNRAKQQIVPPVVQHQLFCASDHELLDSEMENLQELFETLSSRACSIMKDVK